MSSADINRQTFRLWLEGEDNRAVAAATAVIAGAAACSAAATETVGAVAAMATDASIAVAATAKTADESFRVAWLVAPAVMVFAIALAMRLRNRED